MPVAERKVGSLTNRPTAPPKNHLPKTEIDDDDDFIKDLLTDLHALSATHPPTPLVSQTVGFVKNEVWTYSARDNELAERERERGGPDSFSIQRNLYPLLIRLRRAPNV